MLLGHSFYSRSGKFFVRIGELPAQWHSIDYAHTQSSDLCSQQKIALSLKTQFNWNEAALIVLTCLRCVEIGDVNPALQ